MRDGIKAWKAEGYPVVKQVELLNTLIEVNKNDFAACVIDEAAAKKLPKCTFVDFRSKDKYDAGHVEGANHVDYADMFSKPMMEELNKSNDLVIVHDSPEVAGVIAATLKIMDYPSVHILN
ncbi:MAG: rhodanese-like domain-containing protein [Thermodesulfobacteriota bacterium]